MNRGRAAGQGCSRAQGALAYSGERDDLPDEFLNQRCEPAGIAIDLAREPGNGGIFWIAPPDSAIVGDDSAVESAQHNRDYSHRDNARNHHV